MTIAYPTQKRNDRGNVHKKVTSMTAICVVKFCLLVFSEFMMTKNSNNEKIKMTEASASDCLLLVATLESVGNQVLSY